MTKTKDKLIIHPFLFALFPILAIFAHNIYLVDLAEVILPLSISLIFAGLFYSFLKFFLKDKQKTGLIVSLFLFMFFSFGYLRKSFEKFEDITIPIGNIIVGENKLFLLILFALIMISFALKKHNKSPKLINILTISLSIIIFCGMLFRTRYNSELLFDSYFTLIGILLSIYYMFLIYRTQIKLDKLTHFLTLFSGFMVVMNLFYISSYLIKSRDFSKVKDDIKLSADIASNPKLSKSELPDIYYIIMDGYARGDILKERMGYDNSKFLSDLRDRGFYVAEKATSNYMQTLFSVTSSLQLNFLDKYMEHIDRESNDRRPVTKLLRNNTASQFLRKQGYKFIHLTTTPIMLYNIINADYFIESYDYMGLFLATLLKTTFLKPLIVKMRTGHEQILNSFEILKEINLDHYPMFLYAHIVSPHPPFLFGPDGEKLMYKTDFFHDNAQGIVDAGETVEWYIKSYTDQVNYLNKLIISLVDEIKAKSSIPPIIIIQADHGPGHNLHWLDPPEKSNLKERFSILNAYHLPDGGDKHLYESISPVNTFRIIFNHYFNTDYEILPDKSYFSSWKKLYKFVDVTDKVKGSSK